MQSMWTLIFTQMIIPIRLQTHPCIDRIWGQALMHAPSMLLLMIYSNALQVAQLPALKLSKPTLFHHPPSWREILMPVELRKVGSSSETLMQREDRKKSTIKLTKLFSPFFSCSKCFCFGAVEFHSHHLPQLLAEAHHSTVGAGVYSIDFVLKKEKRRHLKCIFTTDDST